MDAMGWKGAASWSRRAVLSALGSSAVTGLVGCGGAEVVVGVPPGSTPAMIIDGYPEQQSYRPGDRVRLYLNARAQARASLRLQDYTGRAVFQFTADLLEQAPAGNRPWETGFGYEQSVVFTLPELPSGVYRINGVVPIIVKSALSRAADVIVVYPTNTVAAYNVAGGRSMYSSPEPATSVSFQRPIGGSNLAFFDATLQWFAGLEFDYSLRYVADIDLDDYNEIAGARLLLVIGHSEYWTRQARENFDRFVMGGGSALLLSGNNMWWQVRYSEDRTQMICYKRVPDPIRDTKLKTVNWIAKELAYPTMLSLGSDFSRGGFGIGYPDSNTGFRILAPASPVFRGLHVKAGDLLIMPTVEYDGAPLLNDPPTQGTPQLDLDALDAYRAEIIGYEYVVRRDDGSQTPDSVGTWLAYQRSATSGTVINGASTNWCSRTGAFGVDGSRVRAIILNMMDLLVNRQSVFTP